MIDGIIDSSILIDCLRGHPGAISFVTRQAVDRPAQTHLVVAAELLTGARNKSELDQIDSFLKSFIVALPNEPDGLAALELIVNSDCRMAWIGRTVRSRPPRRA